MKHPLLLLSVILLIELGPVLPCQASGELPAELKGVCIYHPEPNWWGLARRGMRGKVVCQMTVDPKTGEVTQVKVLRKTAYAELNAEIVLTAFKWKFRPGTITQAKVPFDLIVSGFVRQVH